jgi:transmembrane sensor
MAPGEGLLSADHPTQGRLSDGSVVELARESEVQLLEDTPAKVLLELRRGSATFDVTKRPGRQFKVQAGGVEVRVVGTRFTVTYQADQVQVAVERGVVEISEDGHAARLTAGGSWNSVPPAEPEPEPEGQPVPAPPAPPLRQHVTRPHHRHASSAAPGAANAVPTAEDADELFRGALAARRDGRAADAAIALERFLRDHSSDPRAALAAFELGRLRMGELSDEQGAVDSLELSLRLAPSAPFAEEALSRLVRAYDAMGDTANCLRVRARYLARFPSGPYAQSVTGRCR